MAKYFFSGRFLHCFNLAEHWAPEAVNSAIEGLSEKNNVTPTECISCASEVAKKMGASDEEMIMFVGFAGGLCLSGSACGALAAAIWIKSLKWCREVAKKSSMSNPYSKDTLESFFHATDSKISCSQITGFQFEGVDDHTNFIKNNGCERLIELLAE